VVVIDGDTGNAPDVPEGEKPSPVQFVAFIEVQLSIALCPSEIRFGLALNVTIGTGGGGGGGDELDPDASVGTGGGGELGVSGGSGAGEGVGAGEGAGVGAGDTASCGKTLTDAVPHTVLPEPVQVTV